MFDIRRATARDAGTVSKIHADTWRSAYKGMVPNSFLDGLTDDAWVPTFRDSAAGRQVYLAHRGGQPVGAASFGVARDDHMADFGEIYSIYVLPGEAGKGCGKALMGAVLDRLLEQGYKGAYLYCLKPNVNSHRFYEACGFTYAEGEDKPIDIDGETLVTVQFTLTF